MKHGYQIHFKSKGIYFHLFSFEIKSTHDYKLIFYVNIFVFYSLYEFFAGGRCKKLQNGLNDIVLSTPFSVNQTYHEAGWDSYCTGITILFCYCKVI